MRRRAFHSRQSGGCHDTVRVVGGEGVTTTFRGAPEGTKKDKCSISTIAVHLDQIMMIKYPITSK